MKQWLRERGKGPDTLEGGVGEVEVGSIHRAGALCTRAHPSEHSRPSGGHREPSLEK